MTQKIAQNHFVKTTGFTLLELILVMAIIAMAVAIIVPRLGSNELTLLKVQAREAVAVLNYAHRTAIIRGIPQIATFYVSSEKAASPRKIGSWTSKGASVQWGEELAKSEAESDQEETQHEVIFYPEGGCTGGELILSNEKNKIKITISPLTSKITSEIVDA